MNMELAREQAAAVLAARLRKMICYPTLSGPEVEALAGRMLLAAMPALTEPVDLQGLTRNDLVLAG